MEKKKTGRPGTRAGATAILEKNEIKQETGHVYGRDPAGQVRLAAYSLFEKRGHAHGNDWQDWFEAEKIIYNKK